MLRIERNDNREASSSIKRSMYTSIVDNGDGNHLLYNTLTGSFLKVPSQHVRFLLDDPEARVPAADVNPFVNLLFEKGFLVPEDAVENRRSRMLYDRRYGSDKRLELILLPHENCNFRCTYCYETFSRNKMEPWVREAVKKYVSDRSRDFQLLEVAWFGGEPTIAMDVVEELSTGLIGICDRVGARYTSQITTNGYLLKDEVARKLVYDCRVKQFQITLDGVPSNHNQRRPLAGGGATFDRIYDNLLNMKSLDAPFKVILRINFDAMSAESMEGFIEHISRDFTQDERFIVHFFPISEWGGDKTRTLPICDANIGRALKYQLLEQAVNKGFASRIRNEIEPMGTACYAADPNSFIIGSDGTVYKCTVAFEDTRNRVGAIRPDGSMEIDIDKFALWVTNEGVNDRHCASCFFNPSCHGMSCPLYRMETNESPCPTVKVGFPDALRILAKEMAGTPASKAPRAVTPDANRQPDPAGGEQTKPRQARNRV